MTILLSGLNAEIEPEIWGSPPGLAVGRVKLFTLPKIGLLFYVRSELDLIPENVEIEHIQPTSTTIDGTKGITLEAKASGDPELRLLAGVDLTLRDRAVECPYDDDSATSSGSVSLASSSGTSQCDPCMVYYKMDNVQPLPGPFPSPKPLLPYQDKCYKDSENLRRAKCYSGGPFQSHHIIQEAAVRGLNGYPSRRSSKAFTVLLDRPSHQRANAQQPRPRPAGIYSSEQQIARNALVASGTSMNVNKQLQCADQFFYGLGFTASTPTNSVN